MNLNWEKKAKTLGLIIGIVLFTLLVAGVTYAVFTWISENTDIAGNTECFKVDYTKGSIIDNESVILFDESIIINNNTITVKNGMALTGFTAGLNSGCSIAGNLKVTLDINNIHTAYTTGNSVGAFKYVVAEYSPSTYQTISIGALSGKTFNIKKTGSITSTDTITLVEEEISNTTKGYLIIFYVDGDLAQNDAGESTFSAVVTAEAQQTE